MELLRQWIETAKPFLPLLLTLGGVAGGLFVARLLLERHAKHQRTAQFRNQVILLALSLAGLLAIILALPVKESLRGQVLSLIGILLSAAIAISSTTFLGNAMAGILLRIVRGFRTGDFVSVGDHFGRVSERGLFHTEIQTEDRDLTTVPNLYLVTQPVKVVRASGTVVSATVSLGYDLSDQRVQALLCQAAERAGLEDPFVQITDLGDFSVSYRIAGLLKEVKQLLSTRSDLRACVLRELHAAGIEIVSPNFMNTRALAEDKRFIPKASAVQIQEQGGQADEPEDLVFDKAEEAEARELLSIQLDTVEERIQDLEDRIEKAETDTERRALEKQLAEARALRSSLDPLKQSDKEGGRRKTGEA